MDDDTRPEIRSSEGTITLHGDQESLYIRRLLAILRAARINDQYPDGRRLAATIRAMDPAVHRGAYEGLQIHGGSGLPTYREFTRVQNDVSIAADQLNSLGRRQELAAKAAASDHAVHQRQLAKYDYYDEIKNTPLISLGDMEVSLRRVDAAKNTAHFRILFDKLDVSGIFLRYHILLSQRDEFWGDRMVRLDDETASYTEEFKTLIYRFSSVDAELIFTKLASLSGVRVERVVRGTVGPIFGAHTAVPAPLKEVIGDEDDQFVALFGLDTAATDVTAHGDNDPLADLFETELSRTMRPTYAKSRRLYDYRVHRDRKFVVSRGLEKPLRQLCAQRGTKNIIYSI